MNTSDKYLTSTDHLAVTLTLKSNNSFHLNLTLNSSSITNTYTRHL